jgi:hypothetical protein
MKLKCFWMLLPVCFVLAGCEQSTTTTTTSAYGTNVSVTTNRVEITPPTVVATNVLVVTNK